VSVIYVWPWVFLGVLAYGYFARKVRLYSPDTRGFKFKAMCIGLPLIVVAPILSSFNFVLNPHAPTQSPAVVIFLLMISFLAYDFVARFFFPEAT